ncbi:MAG: NAD(P)-dependent oxidoreductase [Rhodothermales bacterium]|nr:NAD(P)-dependent oxidoreductase [Rhodothermales bacterium]MBO6781066.1 NAD(P)-dependent oxidoreductase [Rhodothermales bacterium]
MKKILITGGAGFIGYHLARHLLETGHEVELLDDFSRGVRDDALVALFEHPGLSLRSANLLTQDMDDLPADYSAIVHLAAMIGVAHVMRRPYRVLTDNVRMLDAALAIGHRQNDLDRFLFASTSEIYAGTLRSIGMTIPTPESTSLVLPPLTEARTSYMLSKAYGEAMCFQSGLPCTVFRPHNVYGPRMGLSHVIPELHRKTRDLPVGGVLEVASPEHRRTFCYVEDAARQIAAMLTGDVVGESLNLGQPGPEIPMRKLAKTLLRAIGRSDVEVRGLPDTPGSPTRRCPDMSRTFDRLGLAPGVSLEEGLRRTTSWYEEHVFSGAGVSAV